MTGYCSYYGDKWQGRHTASGDHYDKNAFTAAHLTLPFNTILEITNLRNNKKVLVRVNDRGPVARSRLLDVSKAAAIKLGMVKTGVEKVSVKVIDSVSACYMLDSLKNYKLEFKPVKIPDNKVSVAKADTKKATKSVVNTTPSVDLENHKVYDEYLLLCKLQGYGVQAGYYKIRANCLAAIATSCRR